MSSGSKVGDDVTYAGVRWKTPILGLPELQLANYHLGVANNMTVTTKVGQDARAWATDNLRGFYMCPVTPPLTDEFELDEEGLRQNIDAFVEMGCTGLVVGGFFAEGWNMTLAEWRRYHEVVANATAGRLPLFTIILDSSAFQAIEKKCASRNRSASPVPRS